MRDPVEGRAAVVEANTDEAAFSTFVERYRRELHLHCYRMLASYEDAQDLVQETFLRAWKSRTGLREQSSARAWLYRIATNACLDFLAGHAHRTVVDETHPEVAWLQPYPDRLLDEMVVNRETIELACLVAIQLLPPNARAVLILRDVLGWSAKETADMLEISVPAVNSALQRARRTLKTHVPARSTHWAAGGNEEERILVQRYMEATERGDAQAILQLMREDARFSMPPTPGVFVGREVVVQGWVDGGFGSASFGTWRCIATRANNQPAVVGYLRRPGEADYHILALDVLRIVDGKIAEITAFAVTELAPAFDVPTALPA